MTGNAGSWQDWPRWQLCIHGWTLWHLAAILIGSQTLQFISVWPSKTNCSGHILARLIFATILGGNYYWFPFYRLRQTLKAKTNTTLLINYTPVKKKKIFFKKKVNDSLRFILPLTNGKQTFHLVSKWKKTKTFPSWSQVSIHLTQENPHGCSVSFERASPLLGVWHI